MLKENKKIKSVFLKQKTKIWKRNKIKTHLEKYLVAPSRKQNVKLKNKNKKKLADENVWKNDFKTKRWRHSNYNLNMGNYNNTYKYTEKRGKTRNMIPDIIKRNWSKHLLPNNNKVKQQSWGLYPACI